MMSMAWIHDNQLIVIFTALMALGFGAGGWMLRDTRKKVNAILGAAEGTGTEIMRDLLRRVARAETKMEEMEPRLASAETISAMSIQKIGFLRFNPFQDMGGDNSFVAALLDRDDNGIVLSSLTMREGARLYAKEIIKGAAKQPLSAEEKQVLEIAMKKS